ncbi:tyrosine--tRNA ligase [Candidatus Woesearchaeota archaeon]|nr:tyrosine--tRNA ligase [Candidatus Woesearchaeota archaeon]
MDTATRLELIREVGEEILTEDELLQLLETKDHPIAYDGFEPSGRVHIAQGIMRAINVNKMIAAGCKFKMLVADWHAWANNKIGGNLDKIQTVGKYLIEVWKATGMDLKNVEFVWVNDFMATDNYLKKVMQIARNSTVKRIIRCSQIMGRSESEALQASQILYPVMQAADIFQLKADICQLGMDQRKVNMLAREVGPKLGWWKPISVHHHMLMSLEHPPPQTTSAVDRAIAMKMSKSRPQSAIFMDDSEEDIKQKIKKAYCPEKIIEDNPIIDYCRNIIFQSFKELKIERPSKFGGDLTIGSFEELIKIYQSGELFPLDLKNSVAKYIIELLKPVKKHFAKNKKAKELYTKVKSYEVTR